MGFDSGAALLGATHRSFPLGFAARVILRPRRRPASRLAWPGKIVAATIVGMLSRVLFDGRPRWPVTGAARRQGGSPRDRHRS